MAGAWNPDTKVLMLKSKLDVFYVSLWKYPGQQLARFLSDHHAHTIFRKKKSVLNINPADPYDISHKLHAARKASGLNNTQIKNILEKKFGEKMSESALSHSIWRGTIHFRRALMKLSVCWVTEVEIETALKK